MPNEIDTLRSLTGEPEATSTYETSTLRSFLEEEGTVDAAAARVWREKAARYAKMFNNGNKSIGQLYDHAKEMRDYFDKRAGTATTTTSDRPSVGRIVRT